MKLEELSKDDLLLVATQLVAGTKLSDIEKIYIPVEVRRIAESLHTLFCKKSHEAGECNYYKVSSWTDKDRKHWVNVVTATQKEFEFANYEMLEYTIRMLWEIEGVRTKGKG
jgi:hypothetical protein